ncbi:hypothetical protein DPEC_G00370740, partial [Dallia pectoralis]
TSRPQPGQSLTPARSSPWWVHPLVCPSPPELKHRARFYIAPTIFLLPLRWRPTSRAQGFQVIQAVWSRR